MKTASYKDDPDKRVDFKHNDVLCRVIFLLL